MDSLIAVWHLLETLGGGLSLVFIVAIAAAMAVLAVVYLVAALAVLDRFARAVRRPGPVVLSSLGLCLLLSAIRLQLESPELAVAPWGRWLGDLALQMALLWPLSLVAMGLCRLAQRRSSPGRGGALLLGVALVGAVATAVLRDGSLSWLGSALLKIAPGVLVLGLVPLATAGLIDIRRGAEWFIATRYLVAERRQVFISAITLICVGAVAAGVWLIITVLSVMNGFEQTWRDEIVGNYAHFLVRSYYGPIVGYDESLTEVRDTEGVVAVSPYIEAEGMVRVAGGGIAPIRLRGIEQASAVEVTSLADKLIAGSLDALASPESAAGEEPEPAPGLVMGRVLAEKLGAETGTEVILISPFGGAKTPLGASPRLMRFRVVGLFESSFLQYDEVYAYSSLPAAQSFRGEGDVVTGLEVRTTDFYRSRRVANRVQDRLGHPFFVRDWKDLFPQFFHALKDNRSLMFMLLIMIMVISAFVIVVTLMMMIMAKSRDVGILKTMGATDESIELIFAIEGTIIGIAGVGAGVVAGMAVSTQLSWIQDRIEQITGVDTLPAEIYQISTLPSQVDPVQVLGVVTIALVLALGATLMPSRHGARLDPVESLSDD